MESPIEMDDLAVLVPPFQEDSICHNVIQWWRAWSTDLIDLYRWFCWLRHCISLLSDEKSQGCRSCVKVDFPQIALFATEMDHWSDSFCIIKGDIGSRLHSLHLLSLHIKHLHIIPGHKHDSIKKVVLVFKKFPWCWKGPIPKHDGWVLSQMRTIVLEDWPSGP